ncbi:hypothetical protein NMY22_g6622 [Coprinellus aureogranulatus]|nr:hypothetical protein NMY22_g6622 [Coprinellus aureogranulatus]
MEDRSDPAPDPRKVKRHPKKKVICITIPERLASLSEWQDKQKGQIICWFYNVMSKSKQAAPNITIDFKGRALTKSQMYSRMFYDDRMKREINAEIVEKKLSRAKAAKEKEDAMSLLKDMMQSGREKEQTPEEYAKIQVDIQPIMHCFFDILAKEDRLKCAMTIAEAPNLNLAALRKSGRNFGKLQYGGEIIAEDD